MRIPPLSVTPLLNVPDNRAHLRGGVTERGVFAFACQYIVSPRSRTGSRTVTQMRHPLLVEGRPNCARQSLASTLSAPRVAATSYIRKNSGKTPETLSERFLEFPSTVRLGSPKPYNSRYVRLPEHFQNSLPPSTAGDASFFRSGSGEGLSEPVMESPAVLGVSLKMCPIS